MVCQDAPKIGLDLDRSPYPIPPDFAWIASHASPRGAAPLRPPRPAIRTRGSLANRSHLGDSSTHEAFAPTPLARTASAPCACRPPPAGGDTCRRAAARDCCLRAPAFFGRAGAAVERSGAFTRGPDADGRHRPRHAPRWGGGRSPLVPPGPGERSRSACGPPTHVGGPIRAARLLVPPPRPRRGRGTTPKDSVPSVQRARALLEEPGVGAGSFVLTRVDSAGTRSFLLFIDDAELDPLRQLLEPSEASTLVRLVRKAAPPPKASESQTVEGCEEDGEGEITGRDEAGGGALPLAPSRRAPARP
jgi:hypothetical protein